jgi:hypothetical protein
MLSIPDKLFTSDPRDQLFFFLVFTTSLGGTDGFYTEAVNAAAYDFILENPFTFSEYFSSIFLLEKEDLKNWASSIYGEIQLSNEGQEREMIDALEKKLVEKFRSLALEFPSPLSDLLNELKRIHYNKN